MELLTVLETALLLMRHLCGFTHPVKKTTFLSSRFQTEIHLPPVTIICYFLMTTPQAGDCPLLKPKQDLECFCEAWVIEGKKKKM